MGYYSGKMMGVQAVSGDADAQAFITATGISDSTQISAVNTLVASLKSYGLWTKMKAIYPFVGGTAESHKWNLKDPRDLDAAFRLQFFGGWVHDLKGATPNGVTGYADTLLNLNILIKTNCHISSYINTNSTKAPTCQIGAGDAGGLSLLVSGGGSDYIGAFDNWNDGANNFIPDAKCFVILSRISNTHRTAFVNGISVKQTNVATNTTTFSTNLHIGRSNDSASGYYDNKSQAFTSVGDGLTDSEALQLYTAVQKYQTTLNRQV